MIFKGERNYDVNRISFLDMVNIPEGINSMGITINFRIIILCFLFFGWPTSATWTASSEGTEKFQYLSPRPEARFVSPENNIIIRYGVMLDQNSISGNLPLHVRGSTSGYHSGQLVLSDDKRTILFKPFEPFNLGESVIVELNEGVKTWDGEMIPRLKFSFFITNTDRATKVKYLRKHYNQEFFKSFDDDLAVNKSISSLKRTQSLNDSLPDEFPEISLNMINDPETGYLFTTLYRFEGPNFGPSFIAITDNYGEPIFYRKFSQMATDLKLLPNGLLTFHHVSIGIPPGGNRYYYLMDQSYTVVDSFCTQNGYITDLHEFRLLKNNHALLLSFDAQIVRMDTIVPGGNPNAFVLGLILQELDSSKNVIFQWRSWDHYEITDADSFVCLTDSIIDYVHGNAIEIDYDNNLLISARNMNEITKINRQTGDIIWRWGGENNQFTFINDNRRFSRQHHIRRLENGNYTLFDNGNHLIPRHSSALEYKLNERNMTATLVWSYRDPGIFGAFMGSTMRLAGGNTLIGWGGTFSGNPAITEVRSDGTNELELAFQHPFISYRAKRYPWDTTILYTNPDTIFFEMLRLTPDTALLEIINPRNEEIFITTASTRTLNFSVIDSLPVHIAANSTAEVLVMFNPVENGIIEDVLTIRVDKATEGYGRQVYIFGENSSSMKNKNKINGKFALKNNYPNPFNPATIIEFDIPKISEVSLKIFNILGEEVATLVSDRLAAGSYSYEWSRHGGLASGVYLYRLQAGNYVVTKKMVLMK